MDDLNLRETGIEGYIFLKIKAKDTDQNDAIFKAFRQVAEVECKNDYTLTLAKLLEYYQQDAKVQMLWNELQRHEERLIALEKSKTRDTSVTNSDGQESF